MNLQTQGGRRLAAMGVKPLFVLLWTIAAFSCVCASAFSAKVKTKRKSATQTVHALLVIMDDDIKIAESVSKNRMMMRNMLDLLPHKDIEIWRADKRRDDGNELKPAHLLDWVSQRNVGPEDTILVYYSGHGLTDYNERHWLDLRKGGSGYSLLRSDLADALQEKPCRLQMLITDACSNFVESTLAKDTVARYGDVVPSERKYVKDLFLAHKGFLDITAASPGEFALGTKDDGGFFTTALATRSFTAAADIDGDLFLSWKEVFAKCKTETENLFQQALPEIRSNPTVFLQMEEARQTTQVPHNYEPLPTRSGTTAPRLPTTEPKIVGNDGAEMVLIPAGEFQMGSNNGDDDEKPVHTVYVDAFYMDVYEVTVGQYRKFLQATGHSALPDGVSKYSPTDMHPVVGVSWHDAMAYAAWAGKRLPTEAEWEKAARGGLQGQKYPWGNGLDASQANYGENLGSTTAVGSYGANGYGLYDMAGNVSEWCVDAHKADFYEVAPPRNPAYLSDQINRARVLRGGGWYFSAQSLRVANRSNAPPTGIGSGRGFRCARGTVTP